MTYIDRVSLCFTLEKINDNTYEIIDILSNGSKIDSNAIYSISNIKIQLNEYVVPGIDEHYMKSNPYVMFNNRLSRLKVKIPDFFIDLTSSNDKVMVYDNVIFMSN